MSEAKVDRVSGSVDLLDEAAGRIKAHLDRRGTAELSELLDEIVREHPSMALRINLAAAVRSAMDAGHEEASLALDRFLLGLMKSRLRAAAGFAALVHENGWTRVATYSRSGQVRECLASSRQAGLSEVLLSEARPAGEGVLLAKELRGEGFRVTLTTDAALPGLLRTAQVLVVGADACFEESFVNKVGTATLLREARFMNLPTMVLAVPEKQLRGEAATAWKNLPLDRPRLLEKLPKGVTWAGELFETVPWESRHPYHRPLAPVVGHPPGNGRRPASADRRHLQAQTTRQGAFGLPDEDWPSTATSLRGFRSLGASLFRISGGRASGSPYLPMATAAMMSY